MIKIFYYITLFFLSIAFIFYNKNKKLFLCPVLFINFNFLLYLLQLSNLIVDDINNSVFLLIIYTNVIFLFFSIFIKNKKIVLYDYNKIRVNGYVNFFNHKISILVLLNIIWILLYLLENYLGSGTIMPVLFKKDIHTFSASIISLITYNGGILAIYDYVFYKNVNKKKYLALCFILLVLPILSRNARMTTMMWAVELLSFYLISNKIFWKKIYKMVILFVCIIFAFVYIGNNRMTHFGKYEISYKNQIKYTGYEDPLEILPWYYGYFPMSFDTLNRSINYFESNKDLHTSGTFTFAPICIGIFKLDSYTDYQFIDYLNSKTKFAVNQTMVPTGFFEFYIDWGIFSFIGLAIYILIYFLSFYLACYKMKYKIIYSIFTAGWFMMSFQNQLIMPALWYGITFVFLFHNVLTLRKVRRNE